MRIRNFYAIIRKYFEFASLFDLLLEKYTFERLPGKRLDSGKLNKMFGNLEKRAGAGIFLRLK